MWQMYYNDNMDISDNMSIMVVDVCLYLYVKKQYDVLM